MGYGRYFYYNGDVYDGTWQNHVRHGHGTYTYGDSGVQWTGTWNNGIRVVDSGAIASTINDIVRVQNMMRPSASLISHLLSAFTLFCHSY